jgi:6-phosphogluconate dehydrogenase (decarboxylating)
MVHNGIEYGDMQLICEAYLIPFSLSVYLSSLISIILYISLSLCVCVTVQLRPPAPGARPDQRGNLAGVRGARRCSVLFPCACARLTRAWQEYNKGDLDSFLIQITADIFRKRDDANPDAYLIDLILDAAGASPPAPVPPLFCHRDARLQGRRVRASGLWRPGWTSLCRSR